MRSYRRFAALLGAAALLLAACGGGSEDSQVATELPDDPVELIAATPDRLAEVSTARIDMHIETVGVPGASFGIDATGAFELGSGNGTMTMDMSALGIPGADGSIEVRIVDRVFYMDFGALAAMLGVPGFDAGWLKLDPVALADEMGLDPEDLGMGTESMDLTQSFEMLRDVADEVEVVGAEEIRGVETTHYRAYVDLAAAYEQGAAQLPSELTAQLDPSVLDGLPLMPVDVWVDDDGLVHRMETTMRFADYAPAGDATFADDATMTMTLDVYDFGVEVDVEAPPEQDTVDMLELFGGFLGGAGGFEGLSQN